MKTVIDRFTTVADPVRVKIAVGACRFIASVSRIDNEEEAKNFIEQVSKEFFDATHNAYAYKLGLGDAAICRYSDAAEPAGTAGPPMLQAIEKAGLTNVVVVGTRYFGGVKLGIGGLIRAYRSCAEAGLKAAKKVTAVLKKKIIIEVSYDLIGAVLREATACGGEVDAVNYQEAGASVICMVPLTAVEIFQKQIQEATSGKAKIIIEQT
mgnify:FL=1